MYKLNKITKIVYVIVVKIFLFTQFSWALATFMSFGFERQSQDTFLGGVARIVRIPLLNTELNKLHTDVISGVLPYSEILNELAVIAETYPEIKSEIEGITDSDLSRRERLRNAEKFINNHSDIFTSKDFKTKLNLAVSLKVAKEKGLIDVDNPDPVQTVIKNEDEEFAPEIVEMVVALSENPLLQQRVALFLLTAQDRWLTKCREFDNETAKIMIRIAEAGVDSENAAEIFNIIEYFADVSNLNRVVKGLDSDGPVDRRSALAELLNVYYLEKNGCTISGIKYEVKTFSIDFSSQLCQIAKEKGESTEGVKKEFDGIVFLRNTITGAEKYIILEAKNFSEEKLGTWKYKIKDALRKFNNTVSLTTTFVIDDREIDIVKDMIFLISTTDNVGDEKRASLMDRLTERMPEFIRNKGLNNINLLAFLYCDVNKDLFEYIKNKDNPDRPPF